MAQLLAPYHNGMRLGQGFNSYTQQICLDKAVLPEASPEAKAVREKLILSKGGQPANELTAGQIVTYSSRFVDKISDVTDAMNISGSLSIKTATIGGKANGSYVDSDKFKSSDINFHLQVKVTNQVHEPELYSIFNPIEGLDDSKFTDVYGDTFISGWELGGELNAIISMKVNDKSKIFDIKAHLEAELSTASIGGKVEANADITKESLSRDTETTIAVNWSGGGSIKDPGDDWTFGVLKGAAAAFPDLVAITPQRTYAILTKYTALKDFYTHYRQYSPLDYENAGIYTSSMLDSYMEYKSLWKQISFATAELEGNRATIEFGQPSEEIHQLALEAEKEPQLQLIQAAAPIPTTPDPDPVQVPIFQASFAGLIAARKTCRFEMAKIVNEVDAVARNPKVAADPDRDSYFLNPLVFKQLLPV
ncbi:hypothetical protein ASPZODRAFT_35469, partial [Penicilliopsis zonata CBS 506.65]